MTEVVTAPPERPAFRDRTAGLILFGIVHILFGLVCAGFILLMAVMSELGARRGGGTQLPTYVFATNVVIYGLFALYFFSVGIGSIRRRRWARALALVVSWMWLIVGLLTAVVLGVMMPRLMKNMPADGANIVMIVTLVTVCVLYILVPAVILLGYRGPNVKATVEHYDRKVRWTDRAPLPVLAVVLLLATGSISLLASTAYATIPIGATIVTGVPAMIICLAFAGLLAFLALGFYRLKLSAWWSLLLLQVIGAGVGAYTLLHTDFDELYTKMGVMTPQLRQLGITEMYRDPVLWIPAGIGWLLFLSFLLWLRRYFVGAEPRTRAADSV
ncbi:MAG TPA: hypothetical protein VGR02_03785 [Thermoanaerobaculia bacterium]|jgi:hypothetical protein|nr:hypothetical protein [Thermoanaerobaculia bacterium]